jgi:hypothetical protein
MGCPEKLQRVCHGTEGGQQNQSIEFIFNNQY